MWLFLKFLIYLFKLFFGKNFFLLKEVILFMKVDKIFMFGDNSLEVRGIVVFLKLVIFINNVVFFGKKKFFLRSSLDKCIKSFKNNYIVWYSSFVYNNLF